MAKLNETAFHAKSDMLVRNYADPKLARCGGHVARSNVQGEQRRRSADCSKPRLDEGATSCLTAPLLRVETAEQNNRQTIAQQ